MTREENWTDERTPLWEGGEERSGMGLTKVVGGCGKDGGCERGRRREGRENHKINSNHNNNK